MISAFVNSFKIPELRSRILFTLGLIIICRVISTVPAPGVDAHALKELLERVGKDNQLFGWINLFSGGALMNRAVGALSIWPYISASIILQLMTAIVPALERLAREGETGRAKLNQYTRYLTLAICVVQGGGLAIGVWKQGLAVNPGIPFVLMMVLTMTTGTMLLMWLGEQITERGIGNGVSIVITVNILSRLPSALQAAVNMFTRPADGGQALFGPFHAVGLLLLVFLVTAATVMLTQGLRKIPIHTTKRVVGRKAYGGQNTYMPLRVNYSGVMPIIFASALLTFPVILLGNVNWFPARRLASMLKMGEPLYMITYSLMILFFSYFWVATQFNPLRIADDLKRTGGYVPGIRPGKPTGEYLDRTMTRLTLVGALFLTAIAVMPSVVMAQFQVPGLVAQFLGGTSLLIVVGVTLDTMRQVESHLLMRHYDGFLKKGRLRGRRG